AQNLPINLNSTSTNDLQRPRAPNSGTPKIQNSKIPERHIYMESTIQKSVPKLGCLVHFPDPRPLASDPSPLRLFPRTQPPTIHALTAEASPGEPHTSQSRL